MAIIKVKNNSKTMKNGGKKKSGMRTMKQSMKQRHMIGGKPKNNTNTKNQKVKKSPLYYLRKGLSRITGFRRDENYPTKIRFRRRDGYSKKSRNKLRNQLGSYTSLKKNVKKPESPYVQIPESPYVQIPESPYVQFNPKPPPDVNRRSKKFTSEQIAEILMANE